MTEQIKREECHIGIYPCCIEFENGKVVRNCYACIEKYGYAKGVYAENQKNKNAWDEVLQELKYLKDKTASPTMLLAYSEAIDIINQHLD